MNQAIYEAYVHILQTELVPAMGCTEPIALAYAAAVARETLGALPESICIRASGNIVKNVKSVVVPHTGGLRGMSAAVAAGIIAGDASKELEVISDVTPQQIAQMNHYLESTPISIREAADSTCVFFLGVVVRAGSHEAEVCIAGYHTNIVLVRYDDKFLRQLDYSEDGPEPSQEYQLLSVERIVEFARRVNLDDVREPLERQIAYNTAVAQAGLDGNWGARIGKILLCSYGDNVANRARAWAAAGSDARMNGCELPVVINSGSGNQGMTASLPVIVYARAMAIEEDTLFRALVVSNLVTIHLKTGIGRLSAYCGVISAGSGAGAGIAFLHGSGYNDIASTIINALAINSGVICDGAKASCAAKISSAVDAGLLGMRMMQHGSAFKSGDGIVDDCVESTIRNVCLLAREGMRETDKTIITLMTEPHA